MWVNEAEFTSEFEHPQRNVNNLFNQLLDPIKCLHVFSFFSMMGSANHSASPQPPERASPTSILLPPLLSPAPRQALLAPVMHTDPPQAPLRTDSVCQPGRKLMQLKGDDFVLGDWAERKGGRFWWAKKMVQGRWWDHVARVRERGEGEEKKGLVRSQDLPLWELTNHETATATIADLDCDFVVWIV